MLTLFHDPTDPASAVAVMRATRLAVEGLPITFEGFEAVGLDATLPVDLGTLALIERMTGPAAAEGLTLRRPAATPPTGLVHVLLARAEQGPAAHEVRRGVYRARWEQDRDLADPSVLLTIAADAGMDTQAVEALLADRVALASRRREMTARRRDGIGGVPVILASRTLVPGLLEEAELRALAAAV